MSLPETVNFSINSDRFFLFIFPSIGGGSRRGGSAGFEWWWWVVAVVAVAADSIGAAGQISVGAGGC